MKKISILAGVLIILATVIILFGGAFAYQYHLIQNQNLKIQNEFVSLPNYKIVALKDVIQYVDVNKNNFIKTTGMIIDLKYDTLGGDVLLSDNSGNYIIAGFGHSQASQDINILSSLKKGDNIEIEGIAQCMSSKDSYYLKNFPKNTPDKIPNIALVGDIKKFTK